MNLGSRGLRDMDEGREVIEDAGERAQVRRQVWVVVGKAALLAAGITAVAMLLPG